MKRPTRRDLYASIDLRDTRAEAAATYIAWLEDRLDAARSEAEIGHALVERLCQQFLSHEVPGWNE